MDNLRQLYKKWQQVLLFLKPMAIPLHSAYTAFFLILSLLPALMLVLQILALTGISSGELVNFAKGFLPQALLPTAEDLVSTSSRAQAGTLLSVSALTALWSASRGMYGLLSGLNAVYGGSTDRAYWRKRGISVIYTFCFLVVLVLTLACHMFGSAVLDYLLMTTDPLLMFLMHMVDLRFLLLLLLQTALFTAMYALLSGKRRRLRDSFPGAVVASLGWLIFSNLFSLYVEHSAQYSNVVGSVSTLTLGMLWLYFCICIVFYGGALNRWLAEKGK